GVWDGVRDCCCTLKLLVVYMIGAAWSIVFSRSRVVEIQYALHFSTPSLAEGWHAPRLDANVSACLGKSCRRVQTAHVYIPMEMGILSVVGTYGEPSIFDRVI
ncbi:unnamed protein product, partial [Choristocarpus tenellus]